MAHGRVPLLPSAMTSAGSAVATSAPAIDAFWPSMPMESVRDGCRVDLRARACCDMRRHWLWEAHPRDVGGQPPAIGSHYVSAVKRSSICLSPPMVQIWPCLVCIGLKIVRIWSRLATVGGVYWTARWWFCITWVMAGTDARFRPLRTYMTFVEQ